MTALLMELVEGDVRSQRISRGTLPLDEALSIVRQIAQALEAAHEQGIIHCDLKPANIKVHSGAVKVLDFGLAKAVDPAAASSPDAANSLALTAHATAIGLILGTAAYMAPEQAKGKPGRQARGHLGVRRRPLRNAHGPRRFAGDTVTDIIAAIVTREPDWLLPAALYGVLVWPFIWGLTEQMTYNGYLMPPDETGQAVDGRNAQREALAPHTRTCAFARVCGSQSTGNTSVLSSHGKTSRVGTR